MLKRGDRDILRRKEKTCWKEKIRICWTVKRKNAEKKNICWEEKRKERRTICLVEVKIWIIKMNKFGEFYIVCSLCLGRELYNTLIQLFVWEKFCFGVCSHHYHLTVLFTFYLYFYLCYHIWCHPTTYSNNIWHCIAKAIKKF